MPPPELRQMRQHHLDEGIGGVVRLERLHVHLGPLNARSTSVHMKHAGLHMGLDRFGRDHISPASTKVRETGEAAGCAPVLALRTWGAGLITTKPLLQLRPDGTKFKYHGQR